MGKGVKSKEQRIFLQDNVSHTLHIESVKFSEACLTAEAIFVLGFGCNDIDGTGVGIAAVQRTLRATQHLNAFDVIQAEVVNALPRDVDVVEVETHGRIDGHNRFGSANPPQKHRGCSALPDIVNADQVGHVVHHIFHIKRLSALDFVGIEGAHCQGHILQGTFPPFSCHDDFLEHQLIALCEYCWLMRAGNDDGAEGEGAGYSCFFSAG